MGLIIGSMYMKLYHSTNGIVYTTIYIYIVMALKFSEKAMLQLYCTACIVCISIAYHYRL